MAFRRFDGFTGSVPQRFIDNNMPVCPMCGSDNPHWTCDQEIKFTKNNYLYKCSECDAILSAAPSDVTGVGRTALTTMGLMKKMSGKNVKAIYITVRDVGKVQTTQAHKNQEFTLDQLVEMANSYK